MRRTLVNAYLLSSSLCVCNDDHLSRDKHRGLSRARIRSLSLSFSILHLDVSLAFLMRVSVVRLHQTLFFSRIVINSFTENERESERKREPGERTKRLEKSFPVTVYLSFVRFLFFFLSLGPFLFFCVLLKENSIIFLLLRLIFFIDGTFVPFPRDRTNGRNYFVNEKRANRWIISFFNTHILCLETQKKSEKKTSPVLEWSCSLNFLSIESMCILCNHNLRMMSMVWGGGVEKRSFIRSVN